MTTTTDENKFSEYQMVVPEILEKNHFDFDELSQADPNSQTLKRFRRCLEEIFGNHFDDKSFEFVKKFRDSGVSFAEGWALKSQLVDDDKIVVVPLVYPVDYKCKSFTVPMDCDSQYRFNQDQAVIEWLNVNGDDYEMMTYRGVKLGPIDQGEKKIYHVFTEMNDEDVLLETFGQKSKAQRFADEYLIDNGTPVTVTGSESRSIEFRSGKLDQLELFAIEINRDLKNKNCFVVIFDETN